MIRCARRASQPSRSFRIQVTIAGSSVLAIIALVAAALLGGLVLNTDTAFSYNGSFSSYADGSTTCWSQWNDTTLFVACDALDDVLIADSTNVWLVTPTFTPTVTPTPSPTPTATPEPLIDIGSAQPIACGQTVAGTSQGAIGNVNTYGCVAWWPETGPEKVYRLTLAAATRVDALLAGMTADLDLFLLTNASPTSCVAYGDTGLTASAIGPGTFYVVIDGFDGAAGSYQLTVWCPLNPTPGPTRTPTVTPTPGATVRPIYFPLLRVN